MSSSGRGRGRGKRKARNQNGFEMWGGYMSAKISKLQGQFRDEAGNSQERKGIFSGIAIFVNGYTNPTGEELKRIMLTHGGTYHHYYSKTHTTHIIASNLPNVKIQNMNTDFIVSPNWITDSLEAERLLDYKNYLLYTHQNTNQPKLTFNKIDNLDEKGSKELSRSRMPLVLKEPDNKAVEKYVSNNNSFVNEKIPDKTSHNTSNPNFLSEFYNNSRLHHISTSGAMFKQYVKELQEREDNFVGRDYLRSWLRERGLPKVESISDTNVNRTIMHIDMDCFFVSVGLINHPELVGQPVAVTHATRGSQPKRNEKEFEKEVNQWKLKYQPQDENSVENTKNSENPKSSRTFSLIDDKCSMAEIASCSYEARDRGVKNGMFLGVALKLCPELKTVSYDFEGYTRVSRNLYSIIASYTKNIEAVSCDEMYVDLGDILRDCQCSAWNFATCIREHIHEETKCACSVGIGPNMVTARLATKRAKPNGQFVLEPTDLEEFMLLQRVTDLPGVGSSLRSRLESKGVTTCGDLQKINLSSLQSTFGNKTGQSLYELCRGIDNKPINKEHQRKSVSAEINYGIRFEDWRDAEKFVSDLSEEVAKRLANVAMKGRNITLKLKVRAKDAPVETAKFMGHGVCDNIAKSATLSMATDEKSVIFRESLSLLKQVSADPKDMRGLGIQISKLEDLRSSSSSVPSIKNFLKLKTSEKKSENSMLSNTNNFNLPNSVSHSLEENKLPIGNEELPKNNGNLRSGSHDENSLNSTFQTNDESSRNCKESLKKEVADDSLTNVVQKTIDMEVLQALPEGLREQVLEEYKAQGYYIPDNYFEVLSPQPGPSNVNSDCRRIRTERNNHLRNVFEAHVIDLEEEEEEEAENEVNFEDLSYSQIDESFLNALPIDVRHELENDLRKKEPHGKSLKKNVNQISLLPCQTKKKRGRPKGNTSIPGKTDSKNTRVSWSTQEIGSSVFNTRQDEIIDVDIQNNTSCTLSPSNSSKPPNLCGETKIDSIRALISRWIESCDSPADIDLSILSSFCISLIEAKDLEQLDLILKFIFRRVNKGSYDWRSGFEVILKEVQTEMIKQYEAPLKFPV